MGGEWTNEVISNRVTVSRKTNQLRVTIKAPEFSMGNNFLTLCITIGAVAEMALTYLMINSSVNLALLVPGFILLAAGLGVAFVRLWLWHNFGEEQINIKVNSFELHRNYGLFKSDVKMLILNQDSELYINRNDNWSWKEFRGKGVFRLSTVDAQLTDFGLNLNDKEFEMIVRPISTRLEELKELKEGLQFSATTTTKNVLDREKAEELESSIEGESKEETQPPNLEQQTGGLHRAALNDYLGKAAGEPSGDLPDQHSSTAKDAIESKTDDQEEELN